MVAIFSVISFLAALGFLLYGGRYVSLFLWLKFFFLPFEMDHGILTKAFGIILLLEFLYLYEYLWYYASLYLIGDMSILFLQIVLHVKTLSD